MIRAIEGNLETLLIDIVHHHIKFNTEDGNEPAFGALTRDFASYLDIWWTKNHHN